MLGQPEPSFEWFKNGRSLRADPRAVVRFDGKEASLTIQDASDNDTGTYKVVATNNSGSSSSNSDVSVIKEITRPEIIEKLTDVQGCEGSEVRLQTKIKGFDSIEWFCGFDKILDGAKYQIVEDDRDPQTLALLVKKLKKSDEGYYKCVAHNAAGRVTTHAEVTVTDKEFAPVFEDHDKTVVTSENREVNAGFTIRGRPKPVVTWYKDGAKLISSRNIDFRSRGDTYSIVIYKTSVNDAGSYRCQATNELGTASCCLDVKVEGLFLSVVFHLHSLFSSCYFICT